MNLKRICLPTIFVIILAFCVSVINVQTQSSIGDGIDLIILIDQSGSMTTGDETVGPTDPEGLRLDAARYLIEYMAFDSSTVNPNRVNRVTVVGFAGWAEVLVYPTTLDSQNNVKLAQDQIRTQSLGGGTNFLAGLKLIREEIFPPATDIELQNDQRRRIIVIVTDGSPFYTEAEDLEYTNQQYFGEIEEYYLQEFGRQEYPLYIVGIDQFNIYWQDVAPFWNEIATPDALELRAFRATNSEEVATKVITFLCPFLGQTGTNRDCRIVELGDHFVPPYAHIVRFSFFKNQQDSEIELARPPSQGGTAVSPNDTDVLFTPHDIRTESYEITFPEPGCWTTTKRGQGRVDVSIDTSFKNFLELRTPSEFHPQLVPLELVFEAKDNNGMPIVERPEFPVQFESHLVDPNGNIQSVSVTKQNGVDGVYISTNDLQTPLPGQYKVIIRGTVNINAADFSCLQENEGGIQTIFDKEFTFEVFQPSLDVIYPEQAHFLYVPLDKISLSSKDDQGNALFLPNASNWHLEVTIESPTGKEILTSSPVWNNGTYEILGPLFLNEVGVYTVTFVADIGGQIFYEGESSFQTTEDIVLLAPRSELPILTPVLTTTVQLQDGNGQPISSNSSFPLRLDAFLIDPEGGSSVVVPLNVITNTVSGQYQAVTPWELETPGLYTIRVTGYISIKDDPTQPEQIAFMKDFSIHGSSDLPRMEVITPNQYGTLEENQFALHGGWGEWFRKTPLLLEVQILNGTSPVAPENIFQGDISRLVTVTIEDVEGNIVLTDVPLTTTSDGRIGVLVTDVPELSQVGDYEARVSLNSERLIDGREYSGVVSDIVVPFRLIETALYRTVRITAIVLLSLLSIALAIAVGLIIWDLLPPYPRGTLTLRTVGSLEILAELCINCRGIKRKRFVFREKDIGTRFQLKMIKIRRVVPLSVGRRRSQTPFKEPEAIIEIEAISKDGRTVSTGKLHASRNGGKPCSQSTDDGKRYEFVYKQ